MKETLEQILKTEPDKKLLAAYGEAKLAREMLANARKLYEEKLSQFRAAIEAAEASIPAKDIGIFKDAEFELFVEP